MNEGINKMLNKMLNKMHPALNGIKDKSGDII